MSRLSTPLTAHHTTKELEKHYRQCKDAKEKTRRQAIWLYSINPSPKEVSLATGLTTNWVYKIVLRYNTQGLKGLIDLHTQRPGGDKRAILNPTQQAQLIKALEGNAPDGGLWTAPKVALWVEQNTGKILKKVTAWTYLRRLGLTLQVPRPKHIQAATSEEQVAFKKK
jgi:transposase